MNNIEITRANADDVSGLQKISRQAFLEAFSATNSKENMEKYLAKAFSIEKLAEELSSPEPEFYFAKLGNEIVGYLKLNTGKSQTECKEDNSLEIERIYVLKEYYGKKVGQLLYEKAIQVANQKDAEYVWLGVWDENPRAISFYKKNGFVQFGTHAFKLGDEEQTDLMMKLELQIKMPARNS